MGMATKFRSIDWAALIKAVPVWMGAIAAVLTTVIAQADAAGWADVSRYAGIVLTWLAAALVIVRKVTPAADVGLPVKD